MRHKRIISALLACMLLLSCSLFPTIAIEAPDNSIIMPRVSGRLNYTFAANATTLVGESFSAAKGDTIKYDCTYTPKSASVDFGYIAPNGRFYFLNRTNGSINETIAVGQTGQFTLAIRNNEDYAVTVTGTVRY